MLTKNFQLLSLSQQLKLYFILTLLAVTFFVFNYITLAFSLLLLVIVLYTFTIRSINKDCKALDEYFYSLEGNFDNHIEQWLEGPLQRLNKSIVDMLRSKSHHNDELHSILKEVNYSANELASNANNVAEQSQHQFQATQTTAAAINQIAQSIDEIFQRIDYTKNMASQTQLISAQGSKTLTLGHQEVSEVVTIANQTADKLAALDQNLKSVLSMSTVINDIADQTNLLALNAAIEAARAGEHGRGFAVVADEVRTLAKRSQDTSLAITEQTSAVSNSMVDVANYMKKFVDVAGSSQQSVSQAMDILNNIMTNSESVAGEMSSVSVACEQQTSAIQEISMAIKEISSNASHQVEMSKQAAEVADYLNGISAKEGQ